VADYLKRAEPEPAAASDEVRRTVEAMLADVERRGEEAIRELSQRLDGWEPDSFVVGPEAIERAEAELDEDLKRHIAFAQARVRDFAERQLATLRDLHVETLRGVRLGHRHVPVGAVGAYVPGGRYPMLASAFMTVVVPKVAGVERVVAAAPPREGRGIHPAMLHAIASSGANQILCLGGVQALAALAFGIEELAPVDMIVGAGNAYVAEAKRQLFGRVGIDLLAGPTEVLVIADATADPTLVAADLIGQAEHGPTSPAVLVTTSRELGAAVLAEVRLLLGWLESREVAAAAWRSRGEVVVARDREEAIDLANAYAYEHVEVHAAEAELDAYLEGLRNYGSLFLGEQATVAFGDKAVGTNHVLPTAGAARYTGGLWVGKFLKTLTYQWLTEEGMRQIAPAAAAISEAELFPGHALTARLRLERQSRRSPVGTGA
jgi:sulfopropanediol 3-dehydrogenase